MIIDLSELSALAAELNTESPRRAADLAHAVTVAESAVVQSRARTGAPRDRPWLATSGIRRRSGRDSSSSWAYVFTVADPEGRPSGFFVEYGTSKMPPQAFMQPAIDPSEASYPAAIAARLDPFSDTGSGGLTSEDG